MNRREFLSECPIRIIKWSPVLGALGFRYHAYTMGPAAGYSGWVTWFGRTVGFVAE